MRLGSLMLRDRRLVSYTERYRKGHRLIGILRLVLELTPFVSSSLFVTEESIAYETAARLQNEGDVYEPNHECR